MSTNPTIRGRGAAENPPNRFTPLARVPLPDYDPSEDPAPQTQFFRDATRRCLEVFAEFRTPVGVVTKSALVTRDADLLGELARHRAAAVFLSVTTLDPDLARRMEPRAATPTARLRAVEELRKAGVPVG